jgi:hypothetical protein
MRGGEARRCLPNAPRDHRLCAPLCDYAQVAKASKHHFSTLHCMTLHCIVLHCIALHCIVLHCITLRYITPPNTGRSDPRCSPLSRAAPPRQRLTHTPHCPLRSLFAGWSLRRTGERGGPRPGPPSRAHRAAPPPRARPPRRRRRRSCSRGSRTATRRSSARWRRSRPSRRARRASRLALLSRTRDPRRADGYCSLVVKPPDGDCSLGVAIIVQL